MVFQEPTKIALQFRVYDQTKLFLAWNAMKPSQSYDKKKNTQSKKNAQFKIGKQHNHENCFSSPF